MFGGVESYIDNCVIRRMVAPEAPVLVRGIAGMRGVGRAYDSDSTCRKFPTYHFQPVETHSHPAISPRIGEVATALRGRIPARFVAGTRGWLSRTTITRSSS